MMQIFVVFKNKFIGILSENETPQPFIFTYADNISPDNYILGLNLRKNISHSLFPIFDDLIPENKYKLDVIKAKYGINNTIEILLHLDNIHGSFEFYKEFYDIPALHNQSVIQYNEIKSEILGDYSFPEILSEYTLEEIHGNSYSNTALGLSGHQEKHAVLKDNVNHVIKHAGKAETEYFIKPFNIDFTHYKKGNMRFVEYKKRYYPYLLVNEHIFMSLAKNFGFDIPYNGLIRDNHYNEYHLIIKRFDRYKIIYKFDHHTINSFLGKSSKDKYNTTVTEVINGIKDKINSSDMLVLFKFIVFSVIVSHGDLHGKNLSLIHSSNQLGNKNMVLSPMYDILTTNIYSTSQNKHDIGIKLNNKNCNIRSSDFLYISNLMDINNAVAKDIINQFCDKFLSSFETHINKLPEKIKALIIKRSDYKDVTLLGEYIQYFDRRKKYIEKYLIGKPAEENIFI